MSYFFLSYASADRQGGFLETFCKDLTAEIRSNTGEALEDIHFRDKENLQPGDNWLETLNKQVLNCRTFVAIFSPSYFKSDFCGKEWAVFQEKLQKLDPDDPPPLFIPILWSPQHRVEKTKPLSIDQMHYDFPNASDSYKNLGLRKFLQLQDLNTEYTNLITEIGALIVDRAEEFVFDPTTITLTAIQNAVNQFAAKLSDADGAIAADDGAGVGTVHIMPGMENVSLVLGAASEHEMNTVRNNISCYGTSPVGWAPYENKVALFAQNIGSQNDFIVHHAPCDANFVQLVENAEKLNNIVMVILDSWALHLDRIKDVFADFQKYRFNNCVLIIPWNLQDSETKENQDALRNLILEALGKMKSTALGIYFRDEIKSEEELKEQMGKAVVDVRQRIMETTSNFRSATGPTSITMPHLNGPTRA